jgi:hypothetical protein
MTEKATSVDNNLTLFISSSSLFYILPALVILVLLVIALPQQLRQAVIYIYRDTAELRGSDPLLRLIYPSATVDQERPGNRLRAG